MMTHCLLLAAIFAVPQAPNELTPSQVEREIRLLAESLVSVRFVSEDFAVDSSGNQVGPASLRFEYSSAQGNRRRVRATAFSEGREILALWYLDDGRKHHQLSPVPNDPLRLDTVSLSNQVDTDQIYTQAMCEALWCFMPRGHRLDALLDAGGKVERVESDGKQVWMLNAQVGPGSLRIELDPDHDWLPRQIQFGENHRYTCTRFQQDNGRWFPAEGHSKKVFKGKLEERGFRLLSLSLNHPINASEFALPDPLEDGVLLISTKGDGVIGDVVGGVEAREAFERATRPMNAALAPGQNLIDPRGSFSSWWLLLLGSVLLAAGVALRIHQSRRLRKV